MNQLVLNVSIYDKRINIRANDFALKNLKMMVKNDEHSFYQD